MLPPAVLWVDPGEVTGLAWYQREMGYLGFRAIEARNEEAWPKIEQIMLNFGAGLYVGWERYTINASTHKLTSQPAALETIGVCKFLARKYRCRALTPAQQHTPNAIERERLKKLGWWMPGRDDAQSAACHLLNWMQQENELPPREREILGR